ncbi:hypothetical protein GCM10010140_40870 [Streptosporangium pseudovulgare]|uniref:Uncharacterized protein n=1 Tax=Streptosporangium pseudovulgare TaxID=35765 RepID=A0ABQ2QZW6_9ACTN|nr:hypothetical protein GCM10010140_40870 [Streptosporangium pseudovulgare]
MVAVVEENDRVSRVVEEFRVRQAGGLAQADAVADDHDPFRIAFAHPQVERAPAIRKRDDGLRAREGEVGG